MDTAWPSSVSKRIFCEWYVCSVEIVLAVWDGRSVSWLSSWCAEWLGWGGLFQAVASVLRWTLMGRIVVREITRRCHAMKGLEGECGARESGRVSAEKPVTRSDVTVPYSLSQSWPNFADDHTTVTLLSLTFFPSCSSALSFSSTHMPWSSSPWPWLSQSNHRHWFVILTARPFRANPVSF